MTDPRIFDLAYKGTIEERIAEYERLTHELEISDSHNDALVVENKRLSSEISLLQDFIASMLRRDTHDDSIKYHYQMYVSADDPLNKVWEDVTDMRHGATDSEGLAPKETK